MDRKLFTLLEIALIAGLILAVLYFGGVLKISPDPAPTATRSPTATTSFSPTLMIRIDERQIEFVPSGSPPAVVRPVSTAGPALLPNPTQTLAPENTAAQPPAPSIIYSSTPGRFAVAIPVRQSLREYTVTKIVLNESVTCVRLVAPDNGALFVVEYCDYPEELIAKFTTSELLDQARDDALAEGRASLVSEQNVSLQSYRGRSLVGRVFYSNGLQGIYRARLFRAGNRLYLLVANSVNENWCSCIDRMDEFLESFYIGD